MAYDLEGARAAGVTDDEIAEYLASKHNYDLAGARQAKVPAGEIVGYLVDRENTTKPKEEAPKEKEKLSYGQQLIRGEGPDLPKIRPADRKVKPGESVLAGTQLPEEVAPVAEVPKLPGFEHLYPSEVNPFDLNEDQRTEKLIKQGVAPDTARATAKRNIAEGVPTTGQEFGIARPLTKVEEAGEEARQEYKDANLATRIGMRSKEQYKSAVYGGLRFAGDIAEELGARDFGQQLSGGAGEGQRESQAILKGVGENPDKALNFIESGISGAINNMAPFLLGTPFGLTNMAVQVFGQEYGEGRDAGLNKVDATARASTMTAAEFIGESISLPKPVFQAFRDIARNLPVDEIMPAFAKFLVKENLAEQVTTALQFGTDKWAPFGIQPNATFGDYLQAVKDTFYQTMAQTLVGGGAATVLGKTAQMVSKPTEQDVERQKIEEFVRGTGTLPARDMLEAAGFITARPKQEETKTEEDKFVDDILGTKDTAEEQKTTSTLSSLFSGFGDSVGKLYGDMKDDYEKLKSSFARPPKASTEPEMTLESLIAKYESEGLNRESAALLANQTLRESQSGTNRVDTGAGQPGVSVPSQPGGTTAGTTTTDGRPVGGDSTAATPAGGGTQTQPGALEGVPASIFQMYKKVRDANAALEAESNATTKRNSTVATKKYFEAVKKLIADQGVTGSESVQLFAKLTSDISNEYDRKIAAGEDVSAPVTKGKRGRKPAPPEQQEAAKLKQNQMAGASRDAARDADKAAAILAKDFNMDDYVSEAEAMDAARALLNDQREAIDTLYDIANSPAHRNNKAGKTAKAALEKVPAEELSLAKERAEAKSNMAKSMLRSAKASSLSESTNGDNNARYSKFSNSEQALNWIARTGNTFEKLLAKRLLPFLKNVKVVIIDDINQLPDAIRRQGFDGAVGMYYESGTERVIYLARDGGMNNTTFLHEAVHGATIARINEYLMAVKYGRPVSQELAKAVADMTELMNQSYAYYSILQSGLDRGIVTDPLQMQMIGMISDFNEAGAFDDVKEFVAYGMTYPIFQEFLHIVPGKAGNIAPTAVDKKNGLTRFVQNVRAFFGMDEKTNSAMQDLLLVSERLMNAPLTQAQQVDAGLPEVARAKKRKTDKILQNIQRGEFSDDIPGFLNDLINLRSWSDFKKLLNASWKTLDSKAIRTLLPTLTTMQIIDWVSDKVPNLDKVVRATEKMGVMRQKMLAHVKDLSLPWVGFAKTFVKGGKDLATLMHYTTLTEVDPTLESNVEDAVNNDAQIAEIRKKKQAAAANQQASFEGQITKREKKIRQAYKLWDKLADYGTRDPKSGLFPGQKIYRDIKRHYKNVFDLHRAILDERIAALKIPGDINDATTPKGRLMSAIRSTYEGKKQIGVYFPLMRYGNFWASFGEKQGREFYMFESEYQRNRFIAARIEQLQKAGDLRTEKQLREDMELDSGNDLTALRQKSTEASKMLTEIFEFIDGQQNVLDKDTLKDAVYQMYLLTMPEQSFRSQFIHRKGTAGFTGDALRNFVRSGYTSAGQLSTLRYSPEIFNAIDAADEALTGNPDKERLSDFTREIRKRIIDEVNPTIEDQLGQRVANGIGQVVFLWFLTSIKSAMVNMTALPIFGLPVLASRYGAIQAGKTLASYMKVWNHTTFAKYDAKGDRVGWTPLSIGFSKHVRTNPILNAAFTEAAERGVTEITRTYDLLAMAKTPSRKFTGRTSRFARGVVDYAGALFHHSERLNREIMFMATFELAYKKAVKAGKSAGVNGEAFQQAIDESVAATYDSMFNYTKFNRPRVIRGPVMRVIGQFKLFPQQVTAYFVRNFYGMWRASYDSIKNISASSVMNEMLKAIPPSQRDAMRQNPQFMAQAEQEAAARRKQATTDLNESAHQFFGSLMMVGLFAGVTGMPLYSTIIGIIQGLMAAARDDDEPVPFEERDLDYWFRYVFLPKYFGDEVARMIAKGPVSVLSNLDVASSVSMDNLWFRDQMDDKSLLTDFRNMIVGSLGPSAGLAENVVKAFEDWRNGHTSHAVEKILPAGLKGAVTQYRWGQEGIVSKTQKAPLFNQDEVSTAMRFWKAVGFNPTELSIQQDKNFKVISQLRKTEEERGDIMRHMKTASLNGNYKDLEKQIERFVRHAIKNPDLEMDVDSIYTAIENAEKARAEAINGVVVSNEKLRARAGFLLGQVPKK